LVCGYEGLVAETECPLKSEPRAGKPFLPINSRIPKRKKLDLTMSFFGGLGAMQLVCGYGGVIRRVCLACERRRERGCRTVPQPISFGSLKPKEPASVVRAPSFSWARYQRCQPTDAHFSAMFNTAFRRNALLSVRPTAERMRPGDTATEIDEQDAVFTLSLTCFVGPRTCSPLLTDFDDILLGVEDAIHLEAKGAVFGVPIHRCLASEPQDAQFSQPFDQLHGDSPIDYPNLACSGRGLESAVVFGRAVARTT
jgi:hypothetical protein